MKILVASALPDAAVEELRSLGSTVVYLPTLSTEGLVSAVRDMNILIVRRTRVTADVIHAATTLQMIVRSGNDVSAIAVEEASAQGIFVCNCPDRDSVAVAEMAMTLLLALDRRLIHGAATGRTAIAKREEMPDAHGMSGRTLGLLGFGPAQRELARRAAAFDMRILAWTPTTAGSLDPNCNVTFVNWPRELSSRCDCLVSYCPPEEGEDARLDAETIGALRDGAHVVHIGVPSAIDDVALADAISRKKLRVAIDAYPAESTREAERFRSPLVDMPEVLVTYRLADRTAQARASIAAEAVRVVRSFLVSGALVNCVNLLERSPATWQLVLRLRDAVGVMATIMEAIRADGINAEEITSRVFIGARAAWCTIALDERPSTEALAAIRSLKGVLHLELRAVV